VDKGGNVTETNIVRNIGAGCGEAALEVVEAMNNMPQKWTPGKQRGRAVKVLYTLPVRFKLQD
jgi:protein TonB